MKIFVYAAKDFQGGVYRGTIKAKNRASAVKALSGRGLLVTKLYQRGLFDRIVQSIVSGVKASELLVFTVQLGVLLEAGMPLVKAMWTIIADLREGEFKTALNFITADVEQGESLFDAMSRYQEIFPLFYLHLIQAGEAGGRLPAVLQNLADYLEESQDLMQKIKTAMYYPVTVIAIGAIVVGFIVLYILPQFKSFYTSFGSELPLATQMFLTVTDFIRGNFAILFGLTVMILFILIHLARTPKGVFIIDNMKIRMFFFKDIFAKAAIARFSRSLALLYEGGIPIVHALDIVSRTLSNTVMERAVQRAARDVKEGEAIITPLRESGIFTNLALSLIDAGEQSGSLAKMLNKIATYYEKEVNGLIRALTSMMEPILIFLMGTMVGATIIILGLPILKLPSLIQ